MATMANPHLLSPLNVLIALNVLNSLDTSKRMPLLMKDV